MKRFFALLIVLALIASLSATAAATVGFTDKSPQSTKTMSKFVFNVSGWEATSQAGTTVTMRPDGSLTTGENLVWKEISGYVVKDTLVKALIQWRMPSQKDTAFNRLDYVDAKLEITWNNLELFNLSETSFQSYAWDEDKNAIEAPATENGAGDKLTVDLGEAAALSANAVSGEQLDTWGELTLTFIVKKSADATVKCNFSAGQNADVDSGEGVYFGGKGHDYYAVLSDDVFHVEAVKEYDESEFDPSAGFPWGVTHTPGSSMDFSVNSANKLTDMKFTYGGTISGSTFFEAGTAYRPSYALDGCIAFDGSCKHTDSMDELDKLVYDAMVKDLNAIMKALGFSFTSHSSVTWGYVTENDVSGLATKLTSSVTYTFKGYSATITVADSTAKIPPTGDTGGLGFIFITLSAAACCMLIRKRSKSID